MSGIRLSDIADLVPADAMELLETGQLIGNWLTVKGCEVTELGYDFRQERAELVVNTPDGQRLEIAIRRISA